MRKVKLFFLLTVLLAIAQGTWADSKSFNGFTKGDNTKLPVTVNCAEVKSDVIGYTAVLKSGKNITISVSAGYTIVSANITVYEASDRQTITATKGTLDNSRPNNGGVINVQNVNNTSTTLSTSGEYRIYTIQVNYTANTYSVSYNANGGTGTTASQTKTHGVTLQLRSNGYSRTGYTFSKWNTQANGKGTNYNAGANYTANAAATMYAQWTVNTYKVRFNGNGSTSGSMSDQNFTYGTAQNLTANAFSKTGHTFAGWATSSTGTKAYNNQQSVTNLTSTNGGTFNLYAVWSVVNYTISYTLNGGTATNPTNYNITTNTFTLNNPTRDGYTFTGWTGSNGSTPQTSVSIEKGSTGNKNYTANWICQAAVDVMNLINAIGTPITLDSKDAIDAARAAYNPLTDAQKTEVTNYATLTAAEAAYNTLVADHAAADAVIDKINAIGSPITATSQTAIEDARAAYNALTDTQKGYVTNYSELTDAEAALAVVNLINAIDDPVVYTNECHQEILDARAAYDALSDEQKALVDATTLQKLTDAEADYDALVADHAAADAVIDLINAIDDPVVYTDACHQEILDAREAYDNLTQAQKDLIDASTLQKLTDAEDAYASLNVDITAKPDPVNDGVYYSTFYDGSRQLQLPANVEAYTATVSGDKMLLKKVAVPGDILPAATAVVLRASQADFTLTPSAASPVSVENNALRGTDVNMEVPSEHCYVLSGADGFVGFYPLSGSYTLTAHKAYIDLDNLPGGVNNAPRRLRFVFSEEQVATGMENVQSDNVQSTKVIENGVLYIIKNGVKYNAQGQIVK